MQPCFNQECPGTCRNQHPTWLLDPPLWIHSQVLPGMIELSYEEVRLSFMNSPATFFTDWDNLYLNNYFIIFDKLNSMHKPISMSQRYFDIRRINNPMMIDKSKFFEMRKKKLEKIEVEESILDSRSGDTRKYEDRRVYDGKRYEDKRYYDSNRRQFDTTKRSYEDKKPYEDRRNYDDRKPYDDRRSYDDKKNFDGRRSYDDRKTYEDRRSFDHKKNYDDKRSFDNKRFYDDKRNYDGRGHSFNRTYDDKRSYDDRKTFDDKRRNYDNKWGHENRRGYDDKRTNSFHKDHFYKKEESFNKESNKSDILENKKEDKIFKDFASEDELI
ncbi:hypothetical protein H311_01293 [Anncaliia algerae PRA109]|nr:hypothetical protein H311_01293 [Anncaliia algerae PRA109]